MTLYEIVTKNPKISDDEWEMITKTFILEKISYICACYDVNGKGSIKVSVDGGDPYSLEFQTDKEMLVEYEKLKKALPNLSPTKKRKTNAK
jgi:hypothetical protein